MLAHMNIKTTLWKGKSIESAHVIFSKFKFLCMESNSNIINIFLCLYDDAI